MPTSLVSGDLFRSGLPALAHGCNCAGAMGKGIAREFRARFPAMYHEYRRRCAQGRFTLGDVFMWRDDGMIIFNLATQSSWRTTASIEAIETAARRMVALAEQNAVHQIGLPRIGSGLGGLPWLEVRQRLDLIGSQTTVQLLVYDGGMPPTDSGSVF
jgi:O-acetyl-ADP-ribose deacetylase (regulator of RNase III)